MDFISKKWYSPHLFSIYFPARALAAAVFALFNNLKNEKKLGKKVQAIIFASPFEGFSSFCC